MSDPDTNKPRRRYRLNVKKLVKALLTMVLIVTATVAAVKALKNAAMVEAALPRPEELVLKGSVTAAPVLSAPASTMRPSETMKPEATPTDTGKAAPAPFGKELSGRLVVVDAGHGGFDPGASGVSGVREDVLNLEVAQHLKDELEGRGAQVVMTRKDENAVGDSKSADMAERRRIIEESGSDIVISIHMNSLEDDAGVSGPLTLFMAGSQQGQKLAQAVIDSLNAALGTNGSAHARDNLFILKSGSQPCVLVECGYLSNKEEESRLKQPDYQKKLAEAICDGAADFLSRK